MRQIDRFRREHVWDSVSLDNIVKFEAIMGAFRLCGYLDQRDEEPAIEWMDIDIHDALETPVVWC